MPHLFAYGTLQLPEVLEAVVGRAAPAEPARLPGYARYSLRGLSYPGLIAEVGAETRGQVFRDLDGDEFARLDAFEDDFYERLAVEVITARGETIPAEVYVVPESARHRIDPRPWDLEAFRVQALHGFLDRRRVAGR